MQFFINDTSSLKKQYSKMYSILGSKRDIAQDTPEIFDVYPEYGQGNIQLYELQGGLLLTLYNHVFKEKITTHFSLSKEYFEIEYCVDGHMHIVESGENSILSKHQISLSLPQKMAGSIIREPHSLYQGISISGSRISLERYLGSLGKDYWEEYLRAFSQQKRREFYLGENTSPEIQDLFHSIFYSRMPLSTKPLYYESKIMELFSVLITEGEQQSALLDRLSQEELDNVLKVNKVLWENRFNLLTLEELAKELETSPFILQESFKTVYGKPIFSYFRELQLHRGAFLLKETNTPITEISAELGYASQSNFGYAFKQRYNLSPTAYRKKYSH